MITADQQDRILGVMFGQSVGDALGIGTQSMTRDDVRRTYPNWLQAYSDIVPNASQPIAMPGVWTNNTDQMLCVLDSLIELNAVEPRNIARRLVQWSQTATIMSTTTRTVISSAGYVNDPHTTARFVWERSKRTWAGNDGLVRTAICGVWAFNDPIAVQYNAAEICKLTHFDPRCVGSSVIIALVISALIDGNESERSIIEAAYDIAAQFDERMIDYVERAIEGELGALDLDEGIGGDETDTRASSYTLKTMAVALWVLFHAPNFRDGLLEIIHEGGDAANNGAVAGAVLGAKFGFESIPAEWVNGMANFHDMMQRGDALLAAYR